MLERVQNSSLSIRRFCSRNVLFFHARTPPKWPYHLSSFNETLQETHLHSNTSYRFVPILRSLAALNWKRTRENDRASGRDSPSQLDERSEPEEQSGTIFLHVLNNYNIFLEPGTPTILHLAPHVTAIKNSWNTTDSACVHNISAF